MCVLQWVPLPTFIQCVSKMLCVVLFFFSVNIFSSLKRRLILKVYTNNSWLHCFTNPLELGTRVSLSHRQPYVGTLIYYDVFSFLL